MSKWTSRKFLIAVGSLLTVIAANLGLPEETAVRITDSLIWIAGFYLGAEGTADAISRVKGV